MNAKQMFKALGYKVDIDKINGIESYCKINEITKFEDYIEFDLWSEELNVFSFNHELLKKRINSDELEAINKRFEELRWL